MPPVDLRDLIGDIRTALERHPREALIEILTYVFKEYVVEGPAPLAATPPALAEDLTGMSFAQVIEALQLRLDLPELALFQVQGDRVSLQLGGRQIPIEAQAARPEPLPPAPPSTPASSPPPAAAPVSSASASPAAAPPADAGQAPGTLRAPLPAAAPRPAAVPMTPGGATGARAPASPGGTPAAPAPATTSPAASDAPARPAARPASAAEEAGEGSGRFNLLEID
ncbi:MAG TPA: hypothetical protein VH877_05775 [Polyangia bacterium]|jgi:hypothetical protein|nr:hypothetical protein [Polyangia bacterium]